MMTMSPSELAILMLAELDELLRTETNRARYVQLVRARERAVELAQKLSLDVTGVG